jgi:hypothetical protein
MTDEWKRVLLIAGVVVLVGVAGVTGYNSLKGNSEPRVTAEFQRMSASEQNQYLDQRERKRRSGGRAPMRRLPDDPPGLNIPTAPK